VSSTFGSIGAPDASQSRLARPGQVPLTDHCLPPPFSDTLPPDFWADWAAPTRNCAYPVDCPGPYTRELSRSRCEVSVRILWILCAEPISLKTRALGRPQALEEYSLGFDVSRARGLSCGNKEVAEVFMPTAPDIGRPAVTVVCLKAITSFL
jgi:hypothetical protein